MKSDERRLPRCHVVLFGRLSKSLCTDFDLDKPAGFFEARGHSNDLNPGVGKEAISRCFLPLFQTSQSQGQPSRENERK